MRLYSLRLFAPRLFQPKLFGGQSAPVVTPTQPSGGIGRRVRASFAKARKKEVKRLYVPRIFARQQAVTAYPENDQLPISTRKAPDRMPVLDDATRAKLVDWLTSDQWERDVERVFELISRQSAEPDEVAVLRLMMGRRRMELDILQALDILAKKGIYGPN